MATSRVSLILVFIFFILATTAAEEESDTAGNDTESTTAEAKGKSIFGPPVPAYPTYNPCSPNPCLNGGSCITSGVSYHCNCISSYHGQHCEHIRVVHNPIACHPNPCLNNGYCAPQYGTGSYICQCQTYYSGTHCEIYTPPNPPTANNPTVCHPNPCLNNGYCVPQYGTGSYVCHCQTYYSGTHCQIYSPIITPTQLPPSNPNQCFPNPCMNGCQCVLSCRHTSGYYCENANGYLGKNCTIPPPVVRCDPNQIVITIDDGFVREYDLGIGNSKLLMTQTVDVVGATGQNCFATTNGISHTFTLNLPFTQCGTNVQDRPGSDQTVVVNNIWLNRMTDGRYDMPVPVICFECTYTKEYSIISSLQPAVDQPPIIRQSGRVVEQGIIGLCKTQACPHACPANFAVTQGAVYTVGEVIHISISGGSSTQGIISLQTLFLSCDGNPSSSLPVVSLVSGGCPAYGSPNAMPASVTHSGLSSTVCASFQVPRLAGCPTFYIHAQLQSCQGVCTVNCRRKRRDLYEDERADIADIYGPIYIIEGSDGIPHKILFPDKDVVNAPGKLAENRPDTEELHNGVFPKKTTIYIIVTASLLCFVALVASVYFVFARSRSISPKLSEDI